MILTGKNDKMIYFISDTHFGHENVIKFCERPYSTVDEMDEDLVIKWNNKVTNKDDVYIIGDMFFKNSYDPEEILSKLRGRKYLILGNHDKWFEDKYKKYFISVSEMYRFKYNKKRYVLCHYPLMTYVGDYMIFGHIHNTKDLSFINLLQSNTNILNAGVDINNYEPVTLDELIDNNNKFYNK